MNTGNLVLTAAATFAGAVLLLQTPTRRRALPGSSNSSGRASRALPGWLVGRPDAMALALRWRLSLAVALVWAALLPTWWWAAPLVAVAGVVGLGQLEPGGVRARRAAVQAQLPEALDLLAACLAAGLPLRAAVRQVSRLGLDAAADGLLRVQSQVDIGIADAQAWNSLSTDSDWGPVARDLALSADSGSALVEVLRRHAEDARARRRATLLKQARTVGVRSTLPLTVCFLPAFLLTGVVPVVAGLIGTIAHR